MTAAVVIQTTSRRTASVTVSLILIVQGPAGAVIQKMCAECVAEIAAHVLVAQIRRPATMILLQSWIVASVYLEKRCVVCVVGRVHYAAGVG